MQEIEIVGKMDHTVDHTFESANRVYGCNGIAPTIPTCSGGGIQPKVIEVKKIKYLGNVRGSHAPQGSSYGVYGPDGVSPCITVRDSHTPTLVACVKPIVLGHTDEHHSGAVYSEQGPAMCITAGTHGYGMGYVLVAQRGRNPDNPKSRVAGIPTEQRLEPRADGCVNMLTTVQKDNLLLEFKPIGTTNWSVGENSCFGPSFMKEMSMSLRANCGNQVAVVESRKSGGCQAIQYAATHFPHGWLKTIVDKSGTCPTIDSSNWKIHTILIEQRKI